MDPNDIKKMIRDANLLQWEVAYEVGIRDNTFCVWLRRQLSPEREKRVLEAIERLKSRQAAGRIGGR